MGNYSYRGFRVFLDLCVLRIHLFSVFFKFYGFMIRRLYRYCISGFRFHGDLISPDAFCLFWGTKYFGLFEYFHTRFFRRTTNIFVLSGLSVFFYGLV